MLIFLRKVVKGFLLLLVVSCFADLTAKGVVLRGSFVDNGVVVVAAEFRIDNGGHVTAPVAKGKSIAPKFSWQNARVMGELWPDPVDVLNSDGGISGYKGYDRDFTVFFKLEVPEGVSSVEYGLSYVVCGDACIPKQEDGTLELDGSLSTEEIRDIQWPVKTEMPDFFVVLLLGLLGGLVLNLMPCVFPIISIKVFSIVRSAQSEPATIRRHAITFFLGTVSVFVCLGAILIALRQTVSGIGWGFYMQEPAFVFTMLLIFLFCGLHFFGLIKLNLPTLKRMKLSIKSGYATSFCSGIFGGLASSSCVGPFSGVAVAGALFFNNTFQSLSIFTAIGVGLGFPFLLIAFFPELIRRIPKPGEWLASFEEFMGFGMLFSCIWPLWVLMSQIRTSGVIVAIASCIAISMFFWLMQKMGQSKFMKAVAFTGLGVSIFFGFCEMVPSCNVEKGISWIEYSDKIFDDAKVEKAAMFLDFTASWCMNCQFNERLFDDEDVIDGFMKSGIKAIKCDWTNRNEIVTNLLKEHGGAAVPFYVYYPGNGKDFVVLSTMLTKRALLEAISGNDNNEGDDNDES
ncbi:MAG: thioredoxin family protein [Holosporales bacterium]|jgi:thiol:disulfide interchange protein|nr:thioredoxin family protein [Holosporales bacterium]